MQLNISITIQDDWPRIKLMITDSQGSFRTESAQYDIAATVFEPIIENALTSAVNSIKQTRKGRQQ